MQIYLTKLFLSALLIVLISETAKRSNTFAALIAALPITSIIAIIWLHFDTATNEQIAVLSLDIFWLVIPSLILFLLLAYLLRHGVHFWWGLGIALAATSSAYLLVFPLLKRLGFIS